MTGSGVRAIRYALESPGVETVVAADIDPKAVEETQTNVKLNDLEARISVVESDANILFLRHQSKRFDLIDLDPFGSPATYFECALRAVLDGGVIAATATDMGPLTAARPAACTRKYGVRPVRTEFDKEFAVRVLAACLTEIAGRLELGISVVFCHASDHYARIYATVSKGTHFANLATKNLGFVEYCSKCLRRDSRSSLEMIQTACEDCGTRTEIGGPIWLGSLWDADLVQRMIHSVPTLESLRLSEVQELLARVAEEQSVPAFHYRTHAMAESLGIRPPKLESVLASLRLAGYVGARTHFHPTGFRTNATARELSTILKSCTY